MAGKEKVTQLVKIEERAGKDREVSQSIEQHERPNKRCHYHIPAPDHGYITRSHAPK